MTPPILHLNEIPDEGLTLDVLLDAGWMRSALQDTGFEPARDPAGRATIRIDKKGRDVLLSGTVDASLTTECVRCLAEMPVQVHSDFTLHLEPATARPAVPPGREIELAAHELDMDYYENDRIDLGQWIREQILLEVPSYPACPSGCKEPLVVPSQDVSGEAGKGSRLAPVKKSTEKE